MFESPDPCETTCGRGGAGCFLGHDIRSDLIPVSSRIGRVWRCSAWISSASYGKCAELSPAADVYWRPRFGGSRIIESFFVKEQLGLSAAFLASLGFGRTALGAQDADRASVDLLWAAQVVFRLFRALLWSRLLSWWVSRVQRVDAGILPPEFGNIISS